MVVCHESADVKELTICSVLDFDSLGQMLVYEMENSSNVDGKQCWSNNARKSLFDLCVNPEGFRFISTATEYFGSYIVVQQSQHSVVFFWAANLCQNEPKGLSVNRVQGFGVRGGGLLNSKMHTVDSRLIHRLSLPKES